MLMVLLDQDGVLSSFVTGACAHHNVPDPYTSGRPEAQGNWGLEALMGIEPEEFWKTLHRPFWAGLPKTPDFDYLLKAAEYLAGGSENVCILTSPCRTDGCRDGKQDWIDEHMPAYSRRVLMGAAKHFVAGPGKVLIDDHDKNIDAWEACGGIGLLVPRPWNRDYPMAGSAADVVKARAAAIKIEYEVLQAA